MIRPLWPLLIGFGIWAVAFIAIYSIQAFGCVWGWDPLWHRIALIGIGGLTLLGLCAVTELQRRRSAIRGTMIEKTGFVLSVISIPVAILVFAPAAVLSICT